MPQKSKAALPFLLTIWAGAYLGLGYYTERSQFLPILLLFALAFSVYYKLCQGPHSLKSLIIIALATRCLFLFSWPAFSDDYFRFIWDGRLTIAGLNPFEQLPSYYLTNLSQVPGLNPDLYQHLNSPQYFSVYPPVCQFIFALSAWFSPEQNLGAIITMRLFLIAAEAGNIFLLIKLLQYYKMPLKNGVWYALNPLVIVELTGNLHFEALVLFFLLSSLYLITQEKLWLAGVLFALAVGVKFVPLLIMPILLVRLGWRKFIYFGGAVTVSLGILFLPFLSGQLVHNIAESLNLYFQKFEFNASIYYLLRWLGFQIVGYNAIGLIGPLLSVLTFCLILYVAYLSYKDVPQHLFFYLLLAFSLYFFLATTVHPWYLTTLVALTVLTNYRYALVWSGLVVLSYATYQTTAYHENMYLIALEYCLVFSYLFYEYKNQKILKKTLLT